MKNSFVYILTNFEETTLYIGVTSALEKRIYEHKNKLLDGFSAKYNLSKLVYYEEFYDIQDAINIEKQLKRWHREWKINLIKNLNPEMLDLAKKW